MWPTTFVVCTYIWHSFNSKSIFKKAGISCLNIFFFICISLPKNRWKELKLFERWNSWQIKSVGFSLTIDRVLKTISELHEFVIESEGFWIYSSASNGRWKGTQERDNGRVSQTSAKAPRPWQTIADLLKTDSDLWVYLTGRVTKASSRDWSVACQIQK